MRFYDTTHFSMTVAALALSGVTVRGQQPASQPDAEQTLRRLSIEDLGKIDVTSTSKHAEPIGEAAAAVTVMTQDDIRRAGVTRPDGVRNGRATNQADLIFALICPLLAADATSIRSAISIVIPSSPSSTDRQSSDGGATEPRRGRRAVMRDHGELRLQLLEHLPGFGRRCDRVRPVVTLRPASKSRFASGAVAVSVIDQRSSCA